MKNHKTPSHVVNDRRMIVEITKNTGRYYKKGEKYEVGCYITFYYGRLIPHYECGVDPNGDGIAITDCKVIKILRKRKYPASHATIR